MIPATTSALLMPSLRPTSRRRGRGPYGTVSSAPVASRQRRAIARSVITSAAPSTAYRASTSENVTHTPLAPVTASSVRITL